MTFRILTATAAVLLAALPAAAQTLPGEAAAIVDTDGDGIITTAEIEALAATLLPAMDSNEDGTVTKDEALVALSEDQFAAVDTNADGTLSADELGAVIRADFAAADLNGNGQID